MKKLIYLLFVICLILSLSSCKDSMTPSENLTDNFDRTQMLTDWADLIIIPGLTSYEEALAKLKAAKDAFISNPQSDTFQSLQSTYLNAYRAWQKVSIFDIGKAEEIGLRNFTNIYPTDTETILNHINDQNYNLELPSNFDTQGFPALDFILYGLAETDAETMSILTASAHQTYLSDLVDRLHDLGFEVLEDWNNGFRSAFIQNNGSSGTASVDKLVNDFLFQYERFFRAGKIGIPAGVFSGNPIPNSVEAPHSNIYSQELFNIAFEALEDFFTGKSFDQSQNGLSLEDYLGHISEQNQTSNIAVQITQQWNTAQLVSENLSPSFKDQIIVDNSKMLQTYDALQEAVILLKVDMMQALNIQVDFVDADGD